METILTKTKIKNISELEQMFAYGRSLTELEITEFCNDVVDEINETLGSNLPYIEIRRNNRLKRCMGRYMFNRSKKKAIRIEFSSDMYSGVYSFHTIEQVVKHELAHYYAHMIYDDIGHNSIFRNVCSKIDCEHDKAISKVKYSYIYKSKIAIMICYCGHGNLLRVDKLDGYYVNCRLCGSKLSVSNNTEYVLASEVL